MEIFGYENYVIYEEGDILNVNTGKYLNPYLNNDGYYQVALCKNGKAKSLRIHRLIAIYYIPNPENKECIDHINRDRTDNRLENLRWVTKYENNQNIGTNRRNTSGHKNISFCFQNQHWVFQKLINNIKIYKGFKIKEDAIEFKRQYFIDNNLEYI